MLGVVLTGCTLFTSSDDAHPVRLCWSQLQQGGTTVRSAVHGDLVFMADGSGTLRARRVSDGTSVWQTRLSDGAFLGMNLVVADSVVVAPTRNAAVGVDVKTGAIRWRLEPPVDSLSPFPGGPRPGALGAVRLRKDGSTVYVPAWGASISAVDARTGAVLWQWGDGNPDGRRSGAMGVSVSGDTLYATVWHYANDLGGLSEYWIVALRKSDGTELWRQVYPPYTSGVSIHGAPVVVGDLLIFALPGGLERAINRFSRETVWDFEPATAEATFSQTERHGGTVYHDGGDGAVYALDATTGTVQWKAPYTGAALVDLLVTERRVYVSGGMELFVFDRLTGKRVTRLLDPSGDESTGHFVGAAVSDQGRVFVPGAKAALCLIEP